MCARREPPFALSVDVEDYFQVQAFAGRISREDWPRFPSRVERNVDRLLDLFDETGAKGTFFVLGWIARRHPELVRRIAARGHEVASHGVTHRMITELTPAEFREEAVESRLLLQDLAQAPVIGFRAPSYSVNRSTLWALEVLRDAGYAYDSSVYPIRRRRYGYPEGPLVPARLPAGARDIAEFPLPTVPLGPLRFPVLAGAYLRLLPSWVSLAATRYHRRRDLPLAVNVHPWEIDPEQPLVGFSRLSKWTHYARLGSTEGILRRVLRGARFASIETRLRELGILEARAAGNGHP
ncbi:MAG TPA: XrtA system polysaccharide deacetylase [Candidatus Polarisedimenticolia bacterium]|nr:XrtA system polysaccharide deacetylase [Candidatus Polarisedimenticolia bacterium]